MYLFPRARWKTIVTVKTEFADRRFAGIPVALGRTVRPLGRALTDRESVNPRSADVTDVLSEVLGRIGTPRWLAGITTLGHDDVIDVPDGYVSLYVVAGGTTHLELLPHGIGWVPLEKGDFVLFPHGRSHRFGERTGTTRLSLDDLLARNFTTRGLETERTTIVYGFFKLASVGGHLFRGVLPRIVRVSSRSSSTLERAEHLIGMLAEEQRGSTPGWKAAVAGLMQVLFVQTLRAHLALQPTASQQGNWLLAAKDSAIGPVVARIHEEPERRWTVKSLARETSMAKSAFSERFRQVVGDPPLQYVTKYRMQKACELLSQSQLDVKEIASRVGYVSASSFSNAFKRWIGKSPASFRSNGG